MKKVIAYILIISGFLVIGTGVYFQTKQNQVKIIKDFNWQIDNDLDSFCSEFEINEYQLNAYNYTQSKIRVPNCLKEYSNSSFLRSFVSEDGQVSLKYEIKNLINIEEDSPLSDYESKEDRYLRKDITDGALVYDIVIKLYKDVYLKIELNSTYNLTDQFFETISDIDYSNDTVVFKKSFEESGLTKAKLKIKDFEKDDASLLEINLPKSYVEEDISFADQKILLTNEEERVSIELFLDPSKAACEEFFDVDAESKDNYFYYLDGDEFLACQHIKGNIFYLVSGVASEIDLFFDFEEMLYE